MIKDFGEPDIEYTYFDHPDWHSENSINEVLDQEDHDWGFAAQERGIKAAVAATVVMCVGFLAILFA